MRYISASMMEPVASGLCCESDKPNYDQKRVFMHISNLLKLAMYPDPTFEDMPRLLRHVVRRSGRPLVGAAGARLGWHAPTSLLMT